MNTLSQAQMVSGFAPAQGSSLGTVASTPASDLVKSYDYSSLITDKDCKDAIACAQSIVDAGNYFKNSPPYQTQENVFSRAEPFWLKYRMSFLTSVFLYLGNEHKVSNMMAWVYMTDRKTQPDRNTLWHHHNKHGMKGLSGILYLHVPASAAGTEIAPNGPEADGKFYIEPNSHTWNIYPSEVWHRPGLNPTDEFRFVLAADIGYQ
jgi:hypothetical protein